MPLARDPRNDRRRRMLRENAMESGGQTGATSARRSRKGQDEPEPQGVRKSAGYSQDVRRACGHRLVQLIPVRPWSYIGLVLVSLAIPALLSSAHYLVYVNGHLPWYGHPLALTLDASYARSLAAWFADKLWMLCLAATVLTFQLRRHKLDDYSGEYRLWFWLVLTCIIGSLEAATGVMGLFGAALNHWAVTTLGWSGPAVVKATVAVLVGLLGLRLCSELKSNPASVVFMLLGLVAWGGSAALAQPELNVSLSQQVRIWLQATLWLGGLTCIWIASLSYLRGVYIEAQQRFLRRHVLATNSVPLGQRMRDAIPSFSRTTTDETDASDSPARRWAMPWSKDRGGQEELEPDNRGAKPSTRGKAAAAKTGGTTPVTTASTASPAKQAAAGTASETSSTSDRDDNSSEADSPTAKRGLLGFLKRDRSETSTAKQTKDDVAARSATPAARSGDQPTEDAQNEEETSSRWLGWLRRPKNNDDAEEFRKVTSGKSAESEPRLTRRQRKQQALQANAAEPTAAAKARSEQDQAEPNAEDKPPKSWLPKMPSIPKPNVTGWTSKIRLPKLKMPKLPSLRLAPPEEEESNPSSSASQKSKSSLPSTAPSGQSSSAARNASPSIDDEDDPDARPLSKAERKRLRRMQQNRAA